MEEATYELTVTMERLIFTHIPSYAKFIRDNHLVDYIRHQLKGARQLNTPLLKIFGDLPDEQIIQVSVPGHIEFLTAASENRLRAFLEESLRKWIDDQLDIVGRDEIEAEDIMQVSFLRKSALLYFLPYYTGDMMLALEITKEIDCYHLEADTISANTYIDILHRRVAKKNQAIRDSEEMLLEAQLIADLGSFNWNLTEKSISATPQLLTVLDIDKEEEFMSLIDKAHPADKTKMRAAMDDAYRDGSYECEYRLETRTGREKIIWSRGVITFEDKRPVIFKGTVMDVTEKHHMVQRLQRSEELYKQAQAIAHIGNWNWDMLHQRFSWSDEMYRIYGIKAGTEVTYDTISSFTHPDDVETVRSLFETVMNEDEPFEFYYRILSGDSKVKILHVHGEVLRDEGKPFKLIGTIQDVTDHHTLLKQLQERDELYKQAQTRTHIGNWSWDIGHDKIVWSDEMYRIYGLEPQSEEVTLERYLGFVHPEQRADRRQQIENMMSSGKPSDFYFTALLEDGSKKTIHSKSEIIYANKQPVKMVGTCQDVTERQRLIDKLLHSEELYKQAQALSHLGNFSWDIATDEIEWTDECFRIYGLEPQSRSIYFETVKTFIHPEDAERTIEKLSACLKNKLPYEDTYRIVLADGTEKIVNRKGEWVTDEKGNLIRMNGTVQDVTLQQRTEQKLLSSREFIAKIADTTPSLILAYNTQSGRSTFVNKALKSILGYDPETLQHKGMEFIFDIIHPEDIVIVQEAMQRVLVNADLEYPADGAEAVFELKYRMRHADGSYRWFKTFTTVFDRSQEQKIEHMLHVSIDITAQELAEQTLQQKNLELQQSNTSLEEYAYVASHDLKEPLRKIATFSDRLLTTHYDQLNENGRLYLQKIIDSSRRMQKMIGDLLTVSTIFGNKGFETTSLKEVLTEVLHTLEYKVEELGATIESDELPSVSIVPSQFRQLFQNLIGNALKFSRENVCPVVRIKHDYLSSDQIAPYKPAPSGKYLKLEISDNGIGFDNQFANKIFAIFQRLHGKTEYEGTGIGLAICRRIAENHGGTISAAGTPDKGATFTIIIPV